MKKKVFKSLLAMACLLCSTNVSAYDFEVDGICYDVVSLSELTCKVVYNEDNYGIIPYEGNIVIPATVNYSNRTLTVVDIAESAFRYSPNVTGITIPNTISKLSASFSDCKKLEHLKIEDGEMTLDLGSYRFSGSSLASIYIGRNLSYYSGVNHYSPFYNITTLQDVTIGNAVTEIGRNAFLSCSGLMNIAISNSVTSIGSQAFRGCSSLIELTIPNSVTEIGDSICLDCSSLTSVTIGNSITKIGESAFANCKKLTNLTIPNSVVTIGKQAFEYSI